MSLTQAAGVIMGTSVGTTITAQIIAFKMTNTAFVLIAVGFLLQFLQLSPRLKQTGKMLFGLGLVFLGMNIMGDAMSPLRTYTPFVNAMTKINHPLFAIAISAIFYCARSVFIGNSGRCHCVGKPRISQFRWRDRSGYGSKYWNVYHCITRRYR